MKYLYAYRNIAIPANAITIVACIQVWLNDSLVAVSVFAWIKVFATAVLLIYIHVFNDNVVFFFMNLGITRRRFYASIAVIDLFIFILFITVIRSIK